MQYACIRRKLHTSTGPASYVICATEYALCSHRVAVGNPTHISSISQKYQHLGDDVCASLSTGPDTIRVPLRCKCYPVFSPECPRPSSTKLPDAHGHKSTAGLIGQALAWARKNTRRTSFIHFLPCGAYCPVSWSSTRALRSPSSSTNVNRSATS